MDKNTFLIEVQKCSTSADWEANWRMTDTIEENDQQLFIDCLKSGADIPRALLIIEKLFEISVNTPLTSRQAFELIPNFRYIVNVLNAHG